MKGFRPVVVLVTCWLVSIPAALAQELRAGAARAKITPEGLGWLGGYGHRNRPAEGVAADLWARALALEDGQGHRRVLVSADIHIVTRRLRREIVEAARTRFGLEERAVERRSGRAITCAGDDRAAVAGGTITRCFIA